jgi:hypothetical protein
MSSQINMTFTKNGNGVSTKPKTKPVHPSILKLMESSQNKALKDNSIESINPHLLIQPKKKDLINLTPQIQPTSSNKKSFLMDFSQLSTSKPCGSCGGR